MSNEFLLEHRCAVLLPLPLAGVLDYSVPRGMEVQPGDIVVVPLNGRERIGVVWDPRPTPDLRGDRLKPVARVHGSVRLEPQLRAFINWVAAYTLSNPGNVLAMTLRRSALRMATPVFHLRRSKLPPAGRLTPYRQRVLDSLGEEDRSPADLAREAKVPAQVIRAMVEKGWLEGVHVDAFSAESGSVPSMQAALTRDQMPCATALCASVAIGRFSVTLLQGATGSGKTEVYFAAVQACLKAGRQVLILLPEIALSTQWLSRFQQRFRAPAAPWHSDLNDRVRCLTWHAAATGHASVVVGARSALFLPFKNLGLIVVDEEHESVYKQEDGVVYHARDMAVVRGRLCQAAVILVSATPSLETLTNVATGRYAVLNLPQRFGDAKLPTVIPIDLRVDQPERGCFLSRPLLEALSATLARGDQGMLFLNRRGYAPMTLCRACGMRIQCPNCTAWLVEHRLARVLTCHYCGHSAPVPSCCPSCGAEAALTAIGPGVERVTEEVSRRFPGARLIVMASDTLTGPNAAVAAAAAIERRQIDLIIGTQVVAKGWHFPHLTLVGVVDADLGLAGGDLRASERTIQLLHQVAGRAGREHAPGTVLLQTHQPEHAVIQAVVKGDFTQFMHLEAEQRRAGHWPPFGRMAALIVSSEHADRVERTARALGQAAPQADGVWVLGPAPAPLSMLRGRHRQRLLLRTRREIIIQQLLRAWLSKVKIPRGVRVEVDVDPISFL